MPTTQNSPLRTFSPEVGGIWTIEAARQLAEAQDKVTGTVQIDPFGEIYQASWLSGTSPRLGLAFHVDRYLFGGWGIQSNYRLSLFRLQTDGSLQGYWVLPTSWGAVSHEVARPDLVDGLEGLYEVDSQDSLTKQRRSSHLSIRRCGDFYQLGNSQFPNLLGLGLRIDDWLIANWCGGRNFGVMAYELVEGEARGGWISPQTTHLNAEVWVKVG